MANFIGRLGVVLGLDSAEFSRGIDAAGKKLESLSGAVEKHGKIAAVALIAASAAALKYADEIADTAKANEVAIDSVLKLRNALANSGGAADNAGKLMSAFTASIDKAADGGDEVQKTFAKLGLSLDDLRKMDMDSMFNKAVQSLAEMTDPITRNAKAMELFGKAAKGVDFVALNDELKAGAGASDEQARGIEAAAAAYDMLAQAGRDFATMLASELGPPLKATLEYMKDINGQGATFGSVFKVAFQTIAVVGANVAFVFEGIAREIGHTIDNAKLLAKFDFAGARAANEKYWAESDQRAAKLESFERRIMGDSGGGRGFMRGDEGQTGAAPAGNRRNVEQGKAAKAKDIADAKKLLDLYIKGYEEEERSRLANRQEQAAQDAILQKGNQAEKMRQQLASISLDREKEMLILQNNGKTMRDEDLQYAQTLMKIEWQRKDAIELINTNDALTQTAKKEALERNNALAQQAIDLEKTRLDIARQSREGGIGQGFLFAADATFRNAKTEFERGGQMFDSVMGNMQTSLDNFVRTGKLSFKDLTRSIIQGLISIQMQAQMLSMMKGIGGLLSNMFVPSNANTIIPMQPGGGYADGGDPPVGRVSVVGERGPELFVPKTAGTIIPNHALAGMGGGGQTVNYNGPFIQNMSAIDTQSGLQFLAKNKASVWSAYQSANRSVPMSR